MPCSCPFPNRIVIVFPERVPLNHSRPLDCLILHCTIADILLDALCSILSGHISVCLLLQAVGPLFLNCTAASILLAALHLNFDHSFLHLQAGDSLFMHYSGHGGSMTDDNGDEADGKGKLYALMFIVSESCSYVSSFHVCH